MTMLKTVYGPPPADREEIRVEDEGETLGQDLFQPEATAPTAERPPGGKRPAGKLGSGIR